MEDALSTLFIHSIKVVEPCFGQTLCSLLGHNHVSQHTGSCCSQGPMFMRGRQVIWVQHDWLLGCSSGSCQHEGGRSETNVASLTILLGVGTLYAVPKKCQPWVPIKMCSASLKWNEILALFLNGMSGIASTQWPHVIFIENTALSVASHQNYKTQWVKPELLIL